jgi:flagellar basal body-associated protein FliL
MNLNIIILLLLAVVLIGMAFILAPSVNRKAKEKDNESMKKKAIKDCNCSACIFKRVYHLDTPCFKE